MLVKSILNALGTEAFRFQVNLRLNPSKGREPESAWMMWPLHDFAVHSEKRRRQITFTTNKHTYAVLVQSHNRTPIQTHRYLPMFRTISTLKTSWGLEHSNSTKKRVLSFNRTDVLQCCERPDPVHTLQPLIWLLVMLRVVPLSGVTVSSWTPGSNTKQEYLGETQILRSE